MAAAHTALMNSADHRAYVLNGQFNYVGIGIVHGGHYGVVLTQQFVGRYSSDRCKKTRAPGE